MTDEFPRFIKWDIEPNCNLRCKHCIMGHLEYDVVAGMESKKEIIDLLALGGCNSILLSSKEPLMSKNIIDILRYSKLTNIQIFIATNGTLISKEISDEICNCNCGFVAVSLEGLSKNTNDVIRGKGNFERAINGIMILNEAKKKNNSIFEIILQICITRYNKYEIGEKLDDFIEKYGITKVVFGFIAKYGEAADNPDICMSYDEQKEIMYDLISNYNFNVPVSFKDLTALEALYYNLQHNRNYAVKPPNCKVCKQKFSLMPDGKMCRCSLLLNTGIIPNEELILSDIRLQSMSEITDISGKYGIIKDGFCLECPFCDVCNICMLYTENRNVKEEVMDTCKTFYEKIQMIIGEILVGTVLFKLKDEVIMSKNGRYYQLTDTTNDIKFGFESVDMPLISKEYVSFENSKINKSVLEHMIYKDLIRIWRKCLNE